MKCPLHRGVALLLPLVFLLHACGKPEALSDEELRDRAQSFWNQSREGETPEALDLGGAVRRALENNLEYRVKQLETALASEDYKLARAEMLPQLTARAGYSQRSEVLASTSERLETGQSFPLASTSTERQTHERSLELSWNFLDVALHYSRAKERANRQHVAREEYRRLAHVLLREVLDAWTRVAAYEQLRPEVMRARELVAQALADSGSVGELRLRNPMKSLEYRQELIRAMQQLNDLLTDMQSARATLAELVAWPAGEQIRIDTEAMRGLPHNARFLDIELETWQRAALNQRPEVRQALYRERIADEKAWSKILELFPRLIGKYGLEYDSNEFLVHNRWRQGAANMAVDLMKLTTLPLRKRSGELEEERAEARSMLQAVSVMSQVMMSRQSYVAATRDWCLTNKLAELDNQRMNLMRARSDADTLDELSYIRAWVDNLVLRVKQDVARADRDYALLTLITSAGVDIVGDETTAKEVENRFQSLMEAGIREMVKTHGDGTTVPDKASAETDDKAAGKSSMNLDLASCSF